VTRLVAVLGYSARRKPGLHTVCARRLAHAESLADEGSVVVLSGEADEMRAAWNGPAIELVDEPLARNTAGNAAGIAAIARELGASEVVVVTSRWHARRAVLLVRAALRGTGIPVTSAPAPDRPGVRQLVREFACLAGAPLQALRLKSG
jgi:uncharacterized SAM-binding protein YcdF (DUF218 family)